MNLLEAITLYAHILKEAGGGLEGRKAAVEALRTHDTVDAVIDAIANVVSNDGNLVGKDGAKFAITQISSS